LYEIDPICSSILSSKINRASVYYIFIIALSDLKLENLLLESKSSIGNIKVIDFGTSRKFNPDEKLTRRIGTVI
jgi:calcium-dependent protein kinase